MSAVEDLKTQLGSTLRYYSSCGRRGPSIVTLETLPMITDKTWRGIPLCRAMSPPVPSTAVETEQLFDLWLWPVLRGEGMLTDELEEASSAALVRFITKVEGFEERTVRLLYALSNADGAMLAHDNSSILVHHEDKTFGIARGRVTSKFCSGMAIDVDHKRILSNHTSVRVGTREFVYLWYEAYRRKENLVEPLTALWQSSYIMFWSKLVTNRVKKKPPTEKQFDYWIGTLENTLEDPMWKMFKILVPKWMTKTTFTRTFGNLSSRKDNPSDTVRQFCINKLCLWFNERLKGN
jgi:hypothetical protein